ncbi:MAG: DUF362 domain-containing protein [Chloroflexi bacterium]|nr:DUF362 domain-containing protein [Chloroflexota bacterium]
MTKENDRNDNLPLPEISRRNFIMLAAAGLLAGCSPQPQPTATSAPPPTATSAPPPTATAAPTSEPTAEPEPTSPPTDEPPPDPLGRVVQVHHAGVWDGDNLVEDAIRQMLDASITQLTGQNDAGQAWDSLFAPQERIAIKVNVLSISSFWTHAPLVMAIAERLQEVGVPAEQIVIFDYQSRELPTAGYTVNKDGPGVRCYGTDGDSVSGWTIMDTEVGLSNILMNCDALINVPILKQHDWSGISFAMKNHYGTFTKPSSFHGERIVRGIAELNALPPIKDRTRLIVGDALAIVKTGWRDAATGDSILMSFDPVAHDTIGLQLYNQMLMAEGGNPASVTERANAWLNASAELGLGVNDLDSIELVEVNMG